jgi:hypothetical protein
MCGTCQLKKLLATTPRKTKRVVKRLAVRKMRVSVAAFGPPLDFRTVPRPVAVILVD